VGDTSIVFGEIEGTGFEVLDARFESCFAGHVRVERLWSGARWLEGPAWFAAGRYLVVSDIPNNRMLRWDETDGSVSVFRAPSSNSNGNTVDREGRLVTCEHLTRRVTRTEPDGSITILADHFEGRRFNSPNDAVVKSDGSIWFTDPSYGIMSDYEGDKAVPEMDGCHVYRIAPDGRAVTRMTSDFDKPNGLAFSPDERQLYIVDSGTPRHIRRFDVAPDGTLGGGEVFAASAGLDGFRLDRDGRVWTSAAGGVNCYDPDGTLIGRIRIPEIVSNVTFGGPKRNRLFICGTTSIYSAFLTVTGVARG
jgi:gluconolactonase